MKLYVVRDNHKPHLPGKAIAFAGLIPNKEPPPNIALCISSRTNSAVKEGKTLAQNVKSIDPSVKPPIVPKEKISQATLASKIEVQHQTSQPSFDSLKAFTGSIIEHGENLEKASREQSSTSQVSSSQPLKPFCIKPPNLRKQNKLKENALMQGEYKRRTLRKKENDHHNRESGPKKTAASSTKSLLTNSLRSTLRKNNQGTSPVCDRLESPEQLSVIGKTVAFVERSDAPSYSHRSPPSSVKVPVRSSPVITSLYPNLQSLLL
ncbi:hypothetical protein KIW84_012697 [Lathyrus oleraceus]|uniref:Uncharacterized protein n=1 Tax=Pisum sativum TaxID=3888 RepID=A0A9D5BIA4_PEA|nr:hypothetical protein KIW84_012697 [Pisum sativum]